MDILKEVIGAEGGLAILLLLSPTIAMGVFGFLWFRSLHASPRRRLGTLLSNGSEINLITRAEYESMLSAMRKEQRKIAADLHEISERLARMEARQEDRRAMFGPAEK